MTGPHAHHQLLRILGVAFGVAVVGAIALYLFLKRTYIGTAIRAIAQDREIIGLMGVDQRRIYLVTSAIGGALTEGLLTPLAPDLTNTGAARATVQALTLFALRAVGILDARARGLVVQSAMPEPDGA